MRNLSKVNNEGFTFIEVLVVIGIIGVVASIALPHYMTYREKSKAVSCLSNRHNINMAETAHYLNNDSPSLTIDAKWRCPSGGTYVWLVSDPAAFDYPKVICSLHGPTSAHEADSLTSLGSTREEITDEMIRLIKKFYEENGRYPRSWGDYSFTDISLDPKEWSIPYEGIYYIPVGNRKNISPDDGFTFYVTDTKGKERKLKPNYNWNLVYSIEDGEWYFKKITENNKIDISTLKVEQE